MNQPFDAKQPLRIGGGLGAANRFRGQMAQVRIYRRALGAEEVAALAVAEPVSRLAQVPAARRTAAQAAKLRSCFLEQYAPEEIQAAHRNVLDLREQRERLIDSFPTVMVMQDSATPRETHVLLRGAYDQPGEKSGAGRAGGAAATCRRTCPHNRLGLARWLVDPANPLTARVAVNRFWQMYFGMGLVKTVEDFGSQGEWPSNPELLDWLATEFIAQRVGHEGDAEDHRDERDLPPVLEGDAGAACRRTRRTGCWRAARASGWRPRWCATRRWPSRGCWWTRSAGRRSSRISRRGCGRSSPVATDYKQEQGEGLYRRSLYTFWKRTAPPPMMMTFDAAGRETCVVRELRTNTPLQALEPDERRHLSGGGAQAGGADDARGRHARRRSASPTASSWRPRASPSEREREILQASFNYYRDYVPKRSGGSRQSTWRRAKRRAIGPGRARTGRLCNVASMILNLDATMTKE